MMICRVLVGVSALCALLCALCFVLCALCFVLCALCVVRCALCFVLCALCFVFVCVGCEHRVCVFVCVFVCVCVRVVGITAMQKSLTLVKLLTGERPMCVVLLDPNCWPNPGRLNSVSIV
jgi:hypothetical protein